LARLGTLYANNKITRDRSQFETWLKDKNNAKVAQAMLKELDELKEIIILNEFDT